MKLYVVHDRIANEDVCCFFMQNVDTLRRSLADCLEDVKNGKGRRPAWLRSGFDVKQYSMDSNKDDCSLPFDCVWSVIDDLLPELSNDD